MAKKPKEDNYVDNHKMVTLSIHRDVYKQVKRIVFEHDLTIRKVVRDILVNYIDSYEKSLENE